MTVIERAIESAKNRKYKLEKDLSHNIADGHRAKAERQVEVMNVTIDALEKQIPKKPNITDHIEDETYMKCPSCKVTTVLFGGMIPNNCPRCGQALDWSEEDEKD